MGAAVPRLHWLVSFPPIIKTRREKEIPKRSKTYYNCISNIGIEKVFFKKQCAIFFFKCKHGAYDSQDDYRI